MSYYFQPVLRVDQKIFIPAATGSSRIKRRYDQAQTPFDRLCATSAISAECRLALELRRDQTNPRRLRQEIYDMIAALFVLPGAATAAVVTKF